MDVEPRIDEFRNLHGDSPVVVMGNGPSLADVPQDWLGQQITIGCNSVYRLIDWPVHYYCIEGRGHLKTEAEREDRMPYVRDVAEYGGWIFVNRRFVHYFEHVPHVRSIDYLDDSGRKKVDFSENPLVQHGSGYSVMYFMLQLAAYLTAGPVLIVGMDHKFDDGQWHPWEDEGPFDAMTQERKNRWAGSAVPYYKIAANWYRDNGRTLLNLTPGTALADEVIPHGDLEGWI